jgi:hypothetical protein
MATRADPWGTKVYITVTAVFTQNPDQAASRSVNKEPNPGWPWSAELDWRPVMPLVSGDNPYFKSSFIFFGLSAKAGFYPFNASWGSLGMGLNFGYTQVSAKSEGIVSKSSFMPLEFSFLYRSPLFFNLMRAWGGLGGGICHFNNANVEVADKYSGTANYNGISAWTASLSAGAGLNFYFAKYLFAGLGANLDILWFRNGLVWLLSPSVDFGFHLP